MTAPSLRLQQAPYLRLRQVCLVAADLARETALVKSMLGLEECHRDANVAKYGLENVLFPVGTNFIEIVSPTHPGTAAGRFLERHSGRYGYMVIMDCDDPARRQAHAQSLGVRIANVIRHDGYFGVQLHPKDTGAAILEFNSTVGGRDPMGAYAPAGLNWQRAIRDDVTRRLVAVEIECPDPGLLASRWSEILERPVQDMSEGKYRIALDTGAINFLPGVAQEAVLAGIELEAAQARDSTISVCGVRFRLRAAIDAISTPY
jgi:Glyoxalase-like domain